MEKKWYYVEYDTFGLENEIYASSEEEAGQIAISNLVGTEITVEEMEE